MVNKNTIKKASILPSILIILGALASQAKSPSLAPEVKGLTEARVGQLVIFSSENNDSIDNYSWEVICLEGYGDYKVINDGKNLIFSAEEEGRYLFICAMTRGNLVDLVVHELVVKNPVPIKPEPDANLNDFEIMIKGWLPVEDYSKEIATRLAYSFDLVAGSGNQGSIDDFLRFTQLSNRAALGVDNLETWLPFLQKLSSYCKKNMQDASYEEHVQLWLHISAALRK